MCPHFNFTLDVKPPLRSNQKVPKANGKNIGRCMSKHPIGDLLYTCRKVDIAITHNINMENMKRKNKASNSYY